MPYTAYNFSCQLATIAGSLANNKSPPVHSIMWKMADAAEKLKTN